MTPLHHSEAYSILNGLGDPSLLVNRQGIVQLANKRAVDAAAIPLQDFDLRALQDDVEGFLTFLSRCSGTGDAIIGTVTLPGKKIPAGRYRCYGNAVRLGGESGILLRCQDASSDRFTLLNKQIRQLNAEVRRHLHTQAVLSETLREREVLIREIHHRVKNNIQVLQGMLLSSAHESKNTEVQAHLTDAARRLRAVGAIQQALYSSKTMVSFRAGDFLDLLISQLKQTWPAEINVDLDAEDFMLPPDTIVPLALIINELLTNSIKYAAGSAKELVLGVRLKRIHDKLELTVHDNGPGFAPGPTHRRSSGLGLVRGLARQLNGRFEVDSSAGARCTLLFESPNV